jgi:GTP-binding protein
LRVGEVRFLGAAATPGGGPPPRLPEIAIAGRSNVGKSSLLNTVVGRRGVARISATPGRTRQINFFAVDDRLVLVDLPGYGFAVGSEAERRAWAPLVEGYLAERPTLRGVLVLVDLRRGIEEDEAQLLAYLGDLGLPAALVATKSDKLGRAAAQAALAALERAAGGRVAVVGFSARTAAGRAELWRLLAAWSALPGRRAAPPRRGGR